MTIGYRNSFHTGLLVEDLQKAMRFYEKTFGLKFAQPHKFDQLQI